MVSNLKQLAIAWIIGFGMLGASCTLQKVDPDEELTELGEGCTIGVLGGVGAAYTVAGILSGFNPESFKIHQIFVTELSSIPVIWFAERQYGFDLEWKTKKLRLPKLNSNGVADSSELDQLGSWIDSNFSSLTFEKLRVPVSIVWADRYKNELIWSSKGRINGPLKKTLVVMNPRWDGSAGSGNEDVSALLRKKQRWVWIVPVELTQESTHWNAWRLMIAATATGSASKSHYLMTWNEPLITEWSETQVNRLFRKGKELFQSHQEKLREMCSLPSASP